MENEKKLATQLLQLKENGYPSPIRAIVGKKKAHILRYLIFVFFTYVLINEWNDLFMRCLFLALLGYQIGAITMEMVFMKKIKDNWPFTVKITNWDIVADIANEPDKVEPVATGQRR